MPRLTPFLLAFLLTLGAARFTAAQTTAKLPILQGRVVDAKTKEPIPLAYIHLRTEHTGTLANAKGHFELAAPQTSATDTLVIEALNYLPHTIHLSSPQLTDSTLRLEKVPQEFAFCNLSTARISLHQLGSQAKKPGEGMIQGLIGAQFALLMQPSPKRRLGTIRSVSFFIGENGFPKEYFRVRIYRADGPNHSPGTNLLTENIVVKAPGGGQWFTVDIPTYNVQAPSEGFFVAMEWILGAGMLKNPCYSSFSDSYTPCGQVMRPTYEFRQSLTWSYTIGKNWNQITVANSKGHRYNAMIRAEIEELH